MLLLDIDQDSRQRTGMKVRQSSTSLRFAGQQVRYVWRERGSARSGRGWSSSRRGCRCCPPMSRPRLRCRCCFHVPKLASCQLELLRRRHARNQVDQATPLSLPFPFTHQVSNKLTTFLRYIFFSNYINTSCTCRNDQRVPTYLFTLDVFLQIHASPL